jgi:hypothetical protein
MTGRTVLVRQAVWSSFGKFSPGESNLDPVCEDYSSLGCELFSLGGWWFQVAKVSCHKDVISSVLSGIQIVK